MKNVKEQCTEMSASNGVQVVKVSSRSTYCAHSKAAANATFGLYTHFNVGGWWRGCPAQQSSFTAVYSGVRIEHSNLQQCQTDQYHSQYFIFHPIYKIYRRPECYANRFINSRHAGNAFWLGLRHLLEQAMKMWP